MKEIFKDIEGYEGLYQVSNLGNVKALGNGGSNSKEKILKPQKIRGGYLRVGLCKQGKRKMYLVHRLVASEFIENPNNYPIINHKDENPSNNCISNLEWCDVAYNNNYGTRNERISKANSISIKGRILSQEWKEKISKTLSKSILQFSKDGNFIKQWNSAKQAGEELNIKGHHITECCKGKLKTCGGYTWRYVF